MRAEFNDQISNKTQETQDHKDDLWHLVLTFACSRGFKLVGAVWVFVPSFTFAHEALYWSDSFCEGTDSQNAWNFSRNLDFTTVCRSKIVKKQTQLKNKNPMVSVEIQI